MRFPDLVARAVTNTFRAKLRTSLTVVAIVIGAFTLTTTSAIGTGISDYIRTQVAAIGQTDTLTVTEAAVASAATGSGPAKYSDDQGATTATLRGTTRVLTERDVTTIRAIPGITGVTKNVALDPSWIEYAGHGRYDLTMNVLRAQSTDLAAGRRADDGASGYQLVLPTTYLQNLGLGSAAHAVGQPVTIGIKDVLGRMHTVQATLVGVQNATLFTTGATANTALQTRLAALQRDGTPSSVAETWTSVSASVAATSTPAEITAVKQRLTHAGYTGLTIDDQLGSLLTVIDGIVGVLDAFAVIALLAAGFGIVNTLLMSVQERTREIGLMKAMGMSGGRVFALFSLEAVCIGFLGSAIGAVLAIGVGSLISARLSATLLSALPGLDLLRFAPASVATIVLVVMLIGFLAGTLPARRAARQNPIDALRYE